MILTNQTTNIVTFLASEDFNSEIVSDQPQRIPMIEVRSSSPASMPSITNVNSHAHLSPMDPEAPPSSLPSNVKTEPYTTPREAKSKKKNQNQKNAKTSE